MKILMTSRDFLPNIGGVASVVLELSKAMVRNGHEVDVLQWIHSPHAGLTDEVIDGVHIFRQLIPDRGKLLRRVGFAYSTRNYLYRLFATKPYDILHAHCMVPDSLGMRWFRPGCPRVFTNHTSGFLQGVQSSAWRRFDWKFILRGFDLVLCPSLELKEWSDRIAGISAVYIPNGVDSSKFYPFIGAKDRIREKYGFVPSHTIIIAARRFAIKNGLRYLAEAFVRAHAVHSVLRLILCGSVCDDEEYQIVRSIIYKAQLEDCVLFTGAIPNAKMIEYYHIADLAVLPSLMEATSVAGLEAMACGLPLIGSNVGGIPQIIIDGKTGLLVEPGDVESLCNSLCMLAADPIQREYISKHASQQVRENFSWDTIAEKTIETYQTVQVDK